MSFKRIRNLREDKDLTQTDIAKLLGMSRTGYAKYEMGACDIPTDVLVTLADYYKTSIDYLLDVTDEKRPYPKKR